MEIASVVINRIREALEMSADFSVKAARGKTDASWLAAREEADASRVFGMRTSEEISRFERKSADEAIKLERQHSDDARTSERSEWLTHERSAAAELSNEREGHAVTRTALAKEAEQTQLICHDLRNPIAAISSCAEMLLDDESARLDPKELEKWLTFIKRNADAAIRLAGDLLDEKQHDRLISSKETGCHDVDYILEQAVLNSQGRAAERKVHLRAMTGTEAEYVVCDRDKIMRVLANLIDNAVKFTPDGGTIEVSRTADGVDAIRLAVADEGPGIPRVRLDEIFSRFSRAEEAKRPGFGLGLYIAKTIVQDHGSQLVVTSHVGVGSKFSFSLPIAKKHVKRGRLPLNSSVNDLAENSSDSVD